MMMVEPASEAENAGIRKLIDELRDRSGQQATIALLERMLSANTAKVVTGFAWAPVFLSAAVRASFSLDEVRKAVAPPEGDGEPSMEEMSLLLGRCLAVAGVRKDEPALYVLNDKTRHPVLLDAKANGTLAEALDAQSQSKDPASGVLKLLLQAWMLDKAPPWESGAIDKMDAQQMEDAVRASSLLVDIWPELKLRRDEMRRRLDLEEIIAPLRVLIGKIGPIGGANGGRDTFVGREVELLRLYDHVGVVPPENLYRWAWRNVRSIVESVTGAPAGALVVHAIGGMGKSALISKFVLDHVGESRLLFAYLDFDRSTLTRATKSALLIEVARQLGLQLDPHRYGADQAAAARERLTELRTNLRHDLSDGAKQTSVDHVEILKEVIDSLPGDPRLLIVIDTVERVQGNDFSALKPTQELLRQLGLFDQGWDRLRVVACSRIDAPELRDNRTSPVAIKLPILNRKHARELAARMLAERHQSRTFAPELITAISDAAQGYPLFVRALVAHVGAAKLESDADLIADLKSTQGKASRVATVFYSRFADRVDLPGGAQTFKVALCLRVVTLSLFKTVMLKLGTKLTAEEMEQAFNDLRNDHTFWAEYEPSKLRWRPDLRALLLGCIREDDAKDGNWLHWVAGIAFDASASDTGGEAKADSLYYALLAGKGIAVADRLWDPSDEFRQALVDAAFDFPLESVEARYIRLVAARQRPSTADLDLLPAATAWRLSWHADPGLAAPTTTGIDFDIVNLLDRAGNLPPNLMDLDARVVALLAKTGRWHEARRRLSRKVIRQPVDLADLLNWMARAIPRSDGEQWEEPLFPRGPIPRGELWEEMAFLGKFLVSDAPATQSERAPAADGEKLISALVVARIQGEAGLFSTVDAMIGDLHSKRLRSANLVTNAIVAGTFGDRAADWATEVTYHSRLLSAVSTRQLLMLVEALHAVGPKSAEELEAVFIREAINAPGGIETARAWTESHVLRKALDSLWILRQEWQENEARRTFFRSFFAVRNPEWIEPLAYAIATEHIDLLRSAIEQLIAQKQLFAGGALLSTMQNPLDPTDMLQALDEAGALSQCLSNVKQEILQKPGILSRLLVNIRFSPPPNVRDDELLGLISRFEAWQAEKNRMKPRSVKRGSAT